MWFANYGILLLLGLLPLVRFLRKKGWGKPATVNYPEAAAAEAAFKGGRRPGSGLREKLRMIIMVLLILAAARPQIIIGIEHYKTSGLDIMLALDISGSMSALDFEPLNRLQAAKSVLREFLARANQDRIGLVAFAAKSYNVCPLTVDYQVLLMLLDHLQIGMTTDGTAIGMALTAAINRLKTSEAKTKIIILLTDGKNNAGQLDPITAAELAAALDIKIYTIGIGREGGAPIIIKDASGEEKLLLDPDGSVHYEEVDEDTLIKIAELTKGKYYRAFDQKRLDLIYESIQDLERTKIKVKNFRSLKDIGYWFLLLACLVFISEIAVSQTIEKRLP